MPLSPGTRIGSYEVTGVIGAGGMGEVYRARDLKLDREVALKVLPELFTSDPDRLARFEREAKVLASLNHPNIAQVFGLEASSTGSSAIAMELVDGQTLDDLLKTTGAPLTLAQALPIMRQIAAALEAAHDQGIVHRDLKPANVKVRDDGAVKVLDFGLAKAFTSGNEASSSVANSPTLTARATQLGVILGTAAYMAPEQAKGRATDRRADVWAFGCVFFELVSGRRAFEGDDVSEVLASVLKSDPDWTALPKDLPAPVTRLLRRCVEKDPKKRLRDASEGLLQLDEALAAGDETTTSMIGVAAAAQRPSLIRRLLPIAAAVIVTAIAAVVIVQKMRPVPPPPEVVRYRFQPASFGVTGNGRDVAVSPDGRLVAFPASLNQGPPMIHLKVSDQLDSAPLKGGEASVAPFFSPDGKWVGAVDPGNGAQLKKISVLGGPAVPIARGVTPIVGAAWLSDGNIVIGQFGGPLRIVSEQGGTPEALTELDKSKNDSDHIWPAEVAGTSLVVFALNTAGRTPIGAAELAIVDRSTRQITRLGVQGSSPKYVMSGYLIYVVADGSLRAIKFDPKTRRVSGSPVPVQDGIAVKNAGAGNFDVSSSGHLVFMPSLGAQATRTLAWVDRAGHETVIKAEARNYFYARVSPDGRRLSLDVRDQDEDIWIWDVQRQTMQRLTDSAGQDQYGIWARDGERVVFSSNSGGPKQEIFWHRPDAVGKPERLSDTTADGLVPYPNAITPDGTQVIFRAPVGGKSDLFLATIGATKSYKKLLATEHEERNAALSFNGKFMAFESDLSGKFEVYVRPFPDVDSRQWTVSTAGGTEPVWGPNMREIYYVSADTKLMSVPVTMSPNGGLDLGNPAVLFDATPYFFAGVGRNYDVAPDGKRFIMVKNAANQSTGTVHITVVLNWLEELRQRLK